MFEMIGTGFRVRARFDKFAHAVESAIHAIPAGGDWWQLENWQADGGKLLKGVELWIDNERVGVHSVDILPEGSHSRPKRRR